MACCVFTAYCMTQLIKACEVLDLKLIDIKYNEFDDEPQMTNDVFNGEDKVVTTKIALEGMTCAACVSSVENAVVALNGVERVSVSLPLARATVVHRSAEISTDDILTVIEEKGYGAKAGERSAQQNLELLEQTAEIQSNRRAFRNAAVAASVVSGLETLARFKLPNEVVLLLRSAIALLGLWIQLLEAKVVHQNAWRRTRSLTLTMDTLVSLSLIMGMSLSLFNMFLFGLRTDMVYWSSGAFLATVILGGRYLDLILRKQSAMTFAKLYQLQQRSMPARLRRSNDRELSGEQVVDAATLAPGDEIAIGSGGIIPCDCYILSGETLVDQSTMTGESSAVSRRTGDFLMSGTHNLSNEVIAIVSKAQEDSALDNLISSISNATETSTADSRADLIISRFVLAILALTIVGFAKSLISCPAGMETWTKINVACERAMAILASACPCALGLATPSAVMAGLDAAWLRGIIVSNGMETLKSISNLTHFVLDKTGTLTTGRLSVSDSKGQFDDLHRVLICAAERDEARTHPVARAVFQWALVSLNDEQRRDVSSAEICNVSNRFGMGISCEIRLSTEQHLYTVDVGNERFLVDCNIQLPHHQILTDHNSNQTLVHFAINHIYTGSLLLSDTVRPEAASVITHLKQERKLAIAMLTGDLESEAQRVSKLLNITTSASHSLPAEKKQFIENLQGEDGYNGVAMMGDGLNDSPALAAANVGICLSTGFPRAGSSIAESTNSQVSDVVFTSPDLTRLPELLSIADKTMQQARWNLYWAAGYNIIAVALAMGIAEPVGLKIDAARAGTMMAFSSISVLAWSFWLRRNLANVSFKAPGRQKISP